MENFKELLSDDDLEKKQKELMAKEDALNKKEKELSALDRRVTDAKYNLYSHINASKETMNKIIAGIAIALVIVIIIAIVTR